MDGRGGIDLRTRGSKPSTPAAPSPVGADAAASRGILEGRDEAALREASKRARGKAGRDKRQRQEQLKAGARRRDERGQAKALEARARRAGRAAPVVATDGISFTPQEVCSPSYVNQVDVENQQHQGRPALFASEEDLAELLAFRASHQKLQQLQPCALAILIVLFTFRKAPASDDGDKGLASLGVQVGIPGWLAWLGRWKERSVQAAFSQLQEERLIERFADSCTVTHLTRNRPPELRRDAWRRWSRRSAAPGTGSRPSKGPAGSEVVSSQVQLYSITYLTPAGAELLEGGGFDVGGRGPGGMFGRRGWLRSGPPGRVARLLLPMWRLVRRRLSGLWKTQAENAPESPTPPPPGFAAEPTCTPYTTLLSGVDPMIVGTPACGELPSAQGAVSRPVGATHTGGAVPTAETAKAPAELAREVGTAPVGPRAEMGGAVPSSSPPPLLAFEAKLAAWHGLTADGYRDGLAWEGGGLVEFADAVARCWARAVRFPEDARAVELERAGELERAQIKADAEGLSWRKSPPDWLPWRCMGCGAPRPRWEARDGGRGRYHAPECPSWGRARRPGPDRVWSPALTPEACWWRDWHHHPEHRQKLERLFAPVRRELGRRLRAFYRRQALQLAGGQARGVRSAVLASKRPEEAAQMAAPASEQMPGPSREESLSEAMARAWDRLAELEAAGRLRRL